MIHKPEETQFAKMLIFSPPGHGKTVFLGTAQEDPRTTPCLILDFEGGTESLAGLDIDVASIRSWEDFDEVYTNLLEGNTVDDIDYSQYKSIGVDSISETHIFALLDILDKEGASRKDPELLEMRDYGKATVQMRRLLRAFRDLPLHVFYTAHTKEIEMPRVGKVQVPSLSGQLSSEISGLMSIVAYLAETEDEEGETHRLLLLKNYPKYRVKARTPWGVEVPDELEDPTVTSLLDLLGYGKVQPKKATRGKAKAGETSE